MQKLALVPALAVSALVGQAASAEVVALYNFEEYAGTTQVNAGTTVPGPFDNHASSAIATASALTDNSLANFLIFDTTRATSDALGSPTLLIGTGNIGGDGMPTPPAPTADADYLSISLTSNVAGLQLEEFSFDFASDVAANTNSSNANGDFTSNHARLQLFYTADGGTTLTAIGSEFVSLADNTDNLGAWTGIQNFSADLSSISALANGSSIEFRLAIRDNRGGGSTSMGHYIDNIAVSAVPEPASLALLGLGGLAIVGRRRA